MPRRERDRELARRRKRLKERRKVRAKGLLVPPVAGAKESEKKKLEKEQVKEALQEVVEKIPTESWLIIEVFSMTGWIAF
jgi:hypothetical protein